MEEVKLGRGGGSEDGVEEVWHNENLIKAYIPRGLAMGNAPDARILRWRYQHVGIWRYLTLKFASPTTPNLKFALSPTPSPDASQWNIGGVASQTQIS